MSLGRILLLAVSVLVLFGVGQRVLDKMRLTDRQALFFMALSLVVNQMDLIWHGLHAPNDLPYRFSFLYCFVLLLIAYEVLIRLRQIRLGAAQVEQDARL